MTQRRLEALAFVSHGLVLSQIRSHRTKDRTVRPSMCAPHRYASTNTILTVAASSAVLGPLLDNYHSQFHVLSYKDPVEFHLQLFGQVPVNFTTASFTPPLFVVAGLIIGTGVLWINSLYIKAEEVSVPHALASITAFSAVYYLSACLPCTVWAPVTGPLLFLFGALQWYVLDGYAGGLIMGLLTAIAGPAIEMILINVGHLYSYSQPEFGGIPLFIIPVYFAGGSAVGNLARAVEALNGGQRREDSKR